MVLVKDPNRDIRGWCAWEICERKPGWIPKVCQLQDNCVQVKLTLKKGRGKKWACRKFRMVHPYSWHCTCRRGGIEPENVKSWWQIQCKELYLIASHKPRQIVSLESHRSHVGIILWAWGSGQLTQRNIPFFIVYGKPHAHTRCLGHLSWLICTNLRQVICLSQQLIGTK